jgi:signal-transduction protein with cAMP-binding, CBS, and nucleotidyltransferase domain
MLTDLSIQSTRDRMLLLRSLAAFASLEDEALCLLAEHVRVRVCRDGERLSTLGEPVRNAYVVLEGTVRWRRDGRAETTSERHGVVGWVTLMARDPNGIEAHASGPAIVLELSADVLEQALEDDFGIVRNSMRLGAHALLSTRGNLPAPTGKSPAFEMGVLRQQRRTMVERLIAMRQVPLFARANAEAMIALVRSSEEVRFEPGQILWRRRDPATFWLLNEYGRIRCTNAEGQHQDLGAGYALGIMDALAQVPRVYEARADTLVIGNRMEVESFMGVMEAYSELSRDYLAFLSRTVLEVQADAREGLGVGTRA